MNNQGDIDFSPCKNCGYPYTAHKWKLPDRHCANYQSSGAPEEQRGELSAEEGIGEDPSEIIDGIRLDYLLRAVEQNFYIDPKFYPELSRRGLVKAITYYELTSAGEEVIRRIP